MEPTYWDLKILKDSILTLAPKDYYYKKCKAISQGDTEWLKEMLLERFIARDSGDEQEEDLKLNGGREVDIEVDGDFICDYTFCDTARDFEKVATKGYEKRERCDNMIQDNKIKVYKKFCRLSKKKGFKMPTIGDLVLYSLQPDRYQDKLNFYKELIDAYRIEIDTEVNKAKESDWVVEW